MSFQPTNGHVNQPFGFVPRFGQDVTVKPQEPESDMTSMLTGAQEEGGSPPSPQAVTLQVHQHRMVQSGGERKR